jgi:hypothetical protein
LRDSEEVFSHFLAQKLEIALMRHIMNVSRQDAKAQSFLLILFFLGNLCGFA